MQSIAKIGLKFSKDPYALENYQQIEKISHEMLEQYTELEFDRPNYFKRDIYPTPNVSVRVLIEQEGKYLFVRELEEQRYTLPGGWCEVFETLKENARSEVIQETGYDVKLNNILAIFPKKIKESGVSEYAVILSGEIIGGSKRTSHETDDVDFFDKKELPILSHKMSREELDIVFDVYENKKEPYFK